MAASDEAYGEAMKLISSIVHSDDAARSRASFKLVPCKSGSQGDILCISPGVASSFADNAKKEQLLELVRQSHVLASCAFTQQGQPCLSLSRSVFFRKCISEVAAFEDSYGCVVAESLPPFAIAVHIPLAGVHKSICTPHSSGTTTLDEGRVLLTACLVSKLLQSRGHAVTVTCPPWLRLRDDVRPFLASIGGSEISTEKDDALSPGASVASEVANVTPSLPDSIHKVIHVVAHRWSYVVQQSVVSATPSGDGVQSSQCQSQCLVGVAGVHCTGRDGAKGADPVTALSDVVSIRTRQMHSVYSVRYGRTAAAKGLADDQNVARKMAEAVVKFQILSADLNCPVKMELQLSSDADNSGVRLDGSFVMYNYARVATLLDQYQRNIERGEYPPPPPVEHVDFSLLSDMEEWNLLCGYVLSYPALVEEAATFRPAHGSMNVTLPVKKICLFLTRLSHTFSSYYSRVKILLAPEPHLMPLIHARILLMKAVQQVMKNGLALLAIDPIDHL